MFIHPWTFVQYYIATAFFLGYRYFKRKVVDGCFTILIYMGVVGLVDLFKGVVVGGLEGIGSIVSKTPRLIYAAEFWSNNVFIFRLKYGGFLSNVVMLGLAALGAYTLKIREDFKLYLISLLFTSSLFYFISIEEIISRLLYNMPFGVITALVVIFLIKNDVLNRKYRMIFMVFIITYMIVYLIRSIANII
ncbi:MAG: hypothetical protein ACFFDN_38000 [Candidatus Hodarchaeota archaeon]